MHKVRTCRALHDHHLNLALALAGKHSSQLPHDQLIGRRRNCPTSTMSFLRLARAPALRSRLSAARLAPTTQRRSFLPLHLSDRKVLDEKYPDRQQLSEAEDPDMNGGYLNPPPIKRQFRDPYAEWWDPQERRNFGEPVHEDNDMLGMFSPHEYTWTTTGPALLMIGAFIAVFLGVSGVVYLNYPDRPAYPREFEGGLERELGGPGAVRARMAGDEDP
ncbi:hypothetical protein G6O67_005563 [Ophiocordyceps sinensis]|uniref:NADH:ubiquinone oxidoreductase 20.1kD subunit n=2 Tax=Ophiocordyceps sinensis TaxID=72228 RepID=A0A8H4PRU2_9HYPO|nr:hypothetical protein G6O67_005563 [Ophiocordyceps sinensis]